MFGPPSSPPSILATDQTKALKSALLPAFGHESSKVLVSSNSDLVSLHGAQSRGQKPTIYRDEDNTHAETGNFLPTPLPTSEANQQTSSPPPSSPQTGPISTLDVSAKLSLSTRSFFNPLQQMIVVRVPTSGQPVTLGRSSKSSTYALRPTNRLASRVHGRLSFDSEEDILKIECLGWNGLTVSVPQEPEHAGKRQEFEVARGQTLNIERVEGITVNMHGDKALVEFWNDGSASDLTEDESWSLSEPASYRAPPAKRARTEPNEDKENQERLSNSPVSPPPASRPVLLPEQAEPFEQTERMPPQEVADEKPEDKSQHESERKPEQQRLPEIPGESLANAIKDDKILEGLSVKIDAPVPDAAAQSHEESHTTNYHSESLTGSRASSAEPTCEQHLEQSSRKSRKQYKPIPEDVKQELMNVAANHVAFSRQSAVPFSSVRKANSTLQSLPKHQVYELMRSIPCIGVIEGGVEDTTGRRADDEYYYDLANDDNEERRRVVQSTKGHRSLRNCRKTPKQYFYRPLHLD